MSAEQNEKINQNAYHLIVYFMHNKKYFCTIQLHIKLTVMLCHGFIFDRGWDQNIITIRQ